MLSHSNKKGALPQLGQTTTLLLSESTTRRMRTPDGNHEIDWSPVGFLRYFPPSEYSLVGIYSRGSASVAWFMLLTSLPRMLS